MTELNKLMPVFNFAAIFVSAVWVIAQLRAELRRFEDTVNKLVEKAAELDNRITKIEIRCDLTHEREA